MKSLRYLILYCLISFGFQKTNAQVYRFKTSSMSVMDKNEKGSWSKWSDFVKAEIIITLDGKKDRFIVNSKELQLYKIDAYIEKISNENDDTLGFNCTDNEGEKCVILIVTRKKEGNRMQFYINYDDLKMVYNIYNTN
jgi:vacuolar-type H+-ATPase subunit I/STV1